MKREMRLTIRRHRSITCGSCFTFNFSPAIRPDLVRAARKSSPELLAHQADERRALVEPVVASDDLEHLKIARRGGEGGDLGARLDHIQTLYKIYIACQAIAMRRISRR